MGALLHDIGKMIVPLGVMNKATRLDKKIKTIRDRFQLLESYTLLNRLQGKSTEEKCEEKLQFLKESLELIEAVNTKSFLPDEDLNQLKKLEDAYCLSPEGEKISIVTPEEIQCLAIRKGTLTDEERKIMEEHVVMTGKILSKVQFNRYFKDSPLWAVTHHETLNGTGYPNKLTEKDLMLESRILAVTDVYDALTSKDRPYKEPMPKEKAFQILYSMVSEGKLDGRVVDALKQCV